MSAAPPSAEGPWPIGLRPSLADVQEAFAGSAVGRLERGAPGAAGVLVVVSNLPDDDLAVLHMSRRPGTMEHFPNEIVFLGGKFDEAKDETFLDTALREAQEEVLIPPESVTVLGTLPAERAVPLTMLMHPFVGVVPATIDPKPTNEATPIAISIAELFAAGAYRQERAADGILAHLFVTSAGPIIGGTAALLASLLRLIVCPPS